jgi:hypothetical protein
MEVGGQGNSQAVLPLATIPATHFTGSWVDLGVGLGRVGKIRPAPGSETWTIQPVARPSMRMAIVTFVQCSNRRV